MILPIAFATIFTRRVVPKIIQIHLRRLNPRVFAPRGYFVHFMAIEYALPIDLQGAKREGGYQWIIEIKIHCVLE